MSDKKLVLIVDDEADIRDGVARWLSATGFETIVAGDGVEGLESALANKPDIILLDVLMPRKDGMETLRDLRANAATYEIPVIMLSAHLRDEQQALDAGARFFVHKPYDGKKLIQTVKATVEPETASAP